MKTLFLLLGLLGAASCSDSKNKDTVPDLCESVCSYNQHCGNLGTGQTKATCVSGCVTAGTPMASTFKPGALGAMAECLEGLGCEDSDAQCTAQAVAKVNPNWTSDPESLACRSSLSACEAAYPEDFSSDYCQFLIFRTGTVAANLKACLAQDCWSIVECIYAALDPIDP